EPRRVWGWRGRDPDIVFLTLESTRGSLTIRSRPPRALAPTPARVGFPERTQEGVVGGGWRIALNAAGGTNAVPVPQRTQRLSRGTKPMAPWGIWAEKSRSSCDPEDRTPAIRPLPERTERSRRQTKPMGHWVVCAEAAGINGRRGGFPERTQWGLGWP